MKLFKLLFALSLISMATAMTNVGLADEPSAPTDIANVEQVRAGLKKLSDHLSDQHSLSDPEIDAITATLKTHAAVFGHSPDIMNTAFELVEAYDAKHQPLWLGGQTLHQKRRQDGDAIDWAIFWVMQNVIDYAYAQDNLKDNTKHFYAKHFGTSDYFPGKIGPNAKPLEKYEVQIDASYPETWGGPFFHQDRPARKPTGAYLEPGAVALVVVPKELVDTGFQIRVGAHSWDLQKKPRVNRLFRVSTIFDIKERVTKVANPLGGGIYIEVPYRADVGVVSILLSGVIRAPYFSMKPFHETTLEQWQNIERNYQAPWADFQSENYQMQLPRTWIYNFDDPVTMMKNWDKAIEASNYAMGRIPDFYGKEVIYNQVDTQLRGRAFHPGYPAGNRGYDPVKDYGGDHQHHVVQGPQIAHSYEFHELGHAYLFPKFAGDREAAVNLPHVAVMNIAFDKDLDEAFRSSRSMDNNTFRTLDTTAIAWMMSDNFVKDQTMKGYEAQYQLKGHAKFVDVVRLFGWEPIHKFFKSLNEDAMAGNPWPRNNAETDPYTMRLSEVTGVDMRPLMHFWGKPTVDLEITNAAYKAKDIQPSPRIYDQLVRYQQLVPADNQAFREYALQWWDKQPSPDGYTTERNHAARWDNYNAELAQQTRHAVQSILDTYFPNGRPAER